MALKEKNVIVPMLGGENRDAGKVFHLTEMDSRSAEHWGGKVASWVLEYGIASAPTPAAGQSTGMAFVAQNLQVALQGGARIPFEEVYAHTELLLERCVRAVPDKSKPEWTRELGPTDIEDPDTRVWLKREVLMMHVNFSTLVSRLALALGLPMTSTSISSPTPTSPPPLPPVYRPGRQRSPNSPRP